MSVNKFAIVFQAGGVAGVLRAILHKVCTPQARCIAGVREIVRSTNGFGIDRPSLILAWGDLLPLDTFAKRIDNADFARNTTWQDVLVPQRKHPFRSNRQGS